MLAFLPTTRRRLDYQRRLLSVSPVPPIGYWPQGEPAGSVALDMSGSNRHGAYTAVTLNKPGKGDGGSAAGFDGSTSFNNIYSAGLAAAFSGAEITLSIWLKVSAAGVWTDATVRRFFYFQADSNNRIYLQRSSSNNDINAVCIAGGTNKTASSTAVGGATGWLHAALTSSKAADQLKLFLNGVQAGTTQTGLGTFAGAIASTTTCIGATGTAVGSPWVGDLQDAAVWPLALPPGAIAELYATGLSGL